MWREKEPREFVITSFSSVDNTSKRFVFKTKSKQSKNQDVHIVYNSFVSLRRSQDESSLILSVEPFTTGREETEEHWKSIHDLGHKDSAFDLFCAPSKALIVMKNDLGCQFENNLH